MFNDDIEYFFTFRTGRINPAFYCFDLPIFEIIAMPSRNEYKGGFTMRNKYNDLASSFRRSMNHSFYQGASSIWSINPAISFRPETIRQANRSILQGVGDSFKEVGNLIRSSMCKFENGESIHNAR